MKKISLFKRYTPPSCTLEIYHEINFINFNQSKLNKNYAFKLIFDDPQFPNQNSVVISGVSTSSKELSFLRNIFFLENLFALISEYISSLTKSDHQKILSNNQNNFKIVTLNLWQHQLITPNQKIINLTNSQLLDLFNALNDFIKDKEQVNSRKKTPLLIALFLGVIITAPFAIWWQQKENITQETVRNTVENEPSIPNNLPEVLPPTPLIRDNLPPLIEPNLPENRENQAPSPPAEIPTPNAILPEEENNAFPPEEENPALMSMIDIDIPSPNIDTPSKENNSTVMLFPSRETASNLPPLGSNKPDLANLPALRERNDQLTEDNDNLILPEIAVLAPKTTTPETEIAQYLRERWQPPENLSQTLTYQLTVNAEKGFITKVTAMGAGASFFLPQTPIPLNEEIIFSPQPDSKPFILTLILSPDGEVVTFTIN